MNRVSSKTLNDASSQLNIQNAELDPRYSSTQSSSQVDSSSGMSCDNIRHFQEDTGSLIPPNYCRRRLSSSVRGISESDYYTVEELEQESANFSNPQQTYSTTLDKPYCLPINTEDDVSLDDEPTEESETDFYSDDNLKDNVEDNYDSDINEGSQSKTLKYDIDDDIRDEEELDDDTENNHDLEDLELSTDIIPTCEYILINTVQAPEIILHSTDNSSVTDQILHDSLPEETHVEEHLDLTNNHHSIDENNSIHIEIDEPHLDNKLYAIADEIDKDLDCDRVELDTSVQSFANNNFELKLDSNDSKTKSIETVIKVEEPKINIFSENLISDDVIEIATETECNNDEVDFPNELVHADIAAVDELIDEEDIPLVDKPDQTFFTEGW